GLAEFDDRRNAGGGRDDHLPPRLQARLRGHRVQTKGSPYRSGRCPDWLKMKNSDAPAVKREAEEDWSKERRRWAWHRRAARTASCTAVRKATAPTSSRFAR